MWYKSGILICLFYLLSNSIDCGPVKKHGHSQKALPNCDGKSMNYNHITVEN